MGVDDSLKVFASVASFESGVEEIFVIAESLLSSSLTTVCRLELITFVTIIAN